MATTTTFTNNTYAGEVAGDWLMRAFYELQSLKNLTVRANIPYKQVVRRLSDTITFAAATCDFTPTGTVTITERVITLEEFQVQRQLCKKDWIQTWDALRAQNGDIGSVEDALVDFMLAGIAEEMERLIWEGVNGTTGEFDGFMTMFDADASVIKITSPEAITPANVVAKVQLVVDAMPMRVKAATEKPILYFSYDVWEKYIQAQTALGNGVQWLGQTGPEVPLRYLGYQIAIAPGMRANSIVFAQKSNLWFGTNKESDFNSIDVLDMKPNDLSKNVRFSADFYAAVQYGFSDEIVVYAPGIS